MPDFFHEAATSGPVCGVDEAGRGPLAGPVMAGAVLIADRSAFLADPAFAALDDSKKLTAKRREALYAALTDHPAVVWVVAEASAAEVDALNPLWAAMLAMTRAVTTLQTKLAPATPLSHALIDGNKLPKDLPVPATAIVKGDSKSLSIAAASVLAKVTRDRVMTALDADYPEYGWASNAGYGAKTHLDALDRLGPTPHHRKSYAPVRAAMEKFSGEKFSG